MAFSTHNEQNGIPHSARGAGEHGLRDPAAEVWPVDPDPPVVVLGAQPMAVDAITAALHRARSQLVAASDRPAWVGEELGQSGTPLVPPSDGVAVAESPLVRHAVAAADGALGRTKNRVTGGGNVDLDTELGPDGGHELLQQPSPAGGGFRNGGAHSRTSRPVNQPASSRVLRASSTVRC
ncbi:MAG: hypothetical protein ACRDTH_06060, partial [Pseudonocardiaceae bacterium]